MCMCVFVCTCVCWRGGSKRKDESLSSVTEVVVVGGCYGEEDRKRKGA